MSSKNIHKILTAMAVILFPFVLNAATPFQEVVEEETITVTKVLSDSTTVSAVFTDPEAARRFAESDALVPAADVLPSKPRRMSPFMFGLELGTCLDLSGTDLSTFNAEIVVGYRHKIIQLLGIRAGIHKSLGTRDSFIPLYVVFRTGFIPRPTLMFMQLSAGYSFNTVASSPMFGDITASVGAGVNLVRRPRFQSNIIFSLGFRHFSERHQQLAQIAKQNVGFAQISFGISM